MAQYTPCQLASIAVVLCFCLGFPSAGLPQAPAGVPHLDLEKYTLPNGLQVILHVDRKLLMVHVNSWSHVGSKNEKFGRTGFARLFEHMMFEGSKDANSKYFGFIEKAGANLFEREPEEVIKATLDSVNAAAEKYATPSKSSLLLVGDASKIEADVRALNIGEVVLLDAEGNPISDGGKT